MTDKNHDLLPERRRRQSPAAVVAQQSALKPEKASQLVRQAKPKTRVFKRRWLTAAGQGKAQLSTEKCLGQLETLMERVKVHSFRGRTLKDLPIVHLTLMQKQALEECVALLQLKLRLQRGETISRNREE